MLGTGLQNTALLDSVSSILRLEVPLVLCTESREFCHTVGLSQRRVKWRNSALCAVTSPYDTDLALYGFVPSLRRRVRGCTSFLCDITAGHRFGVTPAHSHLNKALNIGLAQFVESGSRW